MRIKLLILLCLSQISCQMKPIRLQSSMFYPLESAPLIQEDPEQKIKLGGFSGLVFIPSSNVHEPEFFTMTDRGPNGESFKLSVSANGVSKKYLARNFLLPNFQPRIVRLKIKNKKMEVVEQILLTNPDGSPMTGLPNRDDGTDEVPFDQKNQKLNDDLNGIDTESIARDQNGNFWLGEEYRPSILKFDQKGKLLKRFVPEKSFSENELKILNAKYGANFLKLNLPEIFNQRMINRGFEAMTIYQNKLYAMTQSSLALNDRKESESQIVRILEFDLHLETVTAEYLYEMTTASNKLGDLCVSSNGELYVLEQDGVIGEKGFRSVFKFDLIHATNILNLKLQKNPELMTKSELMKLIRPVQKKLVLDLVQRGFNFAEKLEGLSLLNDQQIAVMNDNDFGVVNGVVTNQNYSVLGIFDL